MEAKTSTMWKCGRLATSNRRRWTLKAEWSEPRTHPTSILLQVSSVAKIFAPFTSNIFQIHFALQEDGPATLRGVDVGRLTANELRTRAMASAAVVETSQA